MFQIGETLRRERERRGLSLADVEARLRIRSRFLAALEEERFELLPGTAYARVFLRDYAELLGLDSSLFLDEYTERFAPLEELEETRAPLPRPATRPPLRPRIVVSVAVAVLLAGLVAGALLGLAPRGERPRAAQRSSPATTARQPRTQPATTTPHTSPPARLVAAPLRAVGAWDPYGDGQEHDGSALAATDGNATTYWYTETYRAGLQKPGVGLLLDAGSPVRLRRLALVTDTPGYVALVWAGGAAGGPFRAVSAAATVTRETSFRLHVAAPERYYVVWITKLAGVARVDEVRAER